MVESRSRLDELEKVVIEGSLSQFLDGQDVPQTDISTLLASGTAILLIENLLQLLWFGANVEQKGINDWRPLHFASRFGPPSAVSILLKAGASVQASGMPALIPLHFAIQRESQTDKVVSSNLIRNNVPIKVAENSP